MTYVPNVRLALRRAGGRELKDATRKGLVTVMSLILIVVLTLDAFHTSVHFMWAMMPVIALLAVVVLFGAVGVFSAVYRAFAAVHLLLDAEKGEVSGFVAHAFLPRFRKEPMRALEVLQLVVRREAGSDAKEPKSWATLELKFMSGTRLEAPDAWGPDEAFEATEKLLLPLGHVLSSLSQKPLEIRRLWLNNNAQPEE